MSKRSEDISVEGGCQCLENALAINRTQANLAAHKIGAGDVVRWPRVLMLKCEGKGESEGTTSSAAALPEARHNG